MTSSLAIYTMQGNQGTIGMAAPKERSCKGGVGADGSVGMTISGPGGESVELSIPNGQGPSVFLACPYFSSAQSIGGCFGSDAPVIGETVNQLSQAEVYVVDPAGVQGAGPLSGGIYSDESVVIWIPGSELTGSLGQYNRGYSVRADCVMPQSNATTCRAILNFVSAWYVNPALAGF